MTELPSLSSPAASSPVDAASVRSTDSAVDQGNVDEDHITVHLPGELPVLNKRASRILLAILVRLTEVEELDASMEGDGRDC